MNTSALYNMLCRIQGAYTVITALWALIDIDSFMKVTGPKTDIWLVKTVAVLLLPIGMCLLSGPYIKRDHWLLMILAIGSSLGLVFIDFYYTANGTIKWIYRMDGYLQIIFLLTWFYLLIKRNRLKKH